MLVILLWMLWQPFVLDDNDPVLQSCRKHIIGIHSHAYIFHNAPCKSATFHTDNNCKGRTPRWEGIDQDWTLEIQSGIMRLLHTQTVFPPFYYKRHVGIDLIVSICHLAATVIVGDRLLIVAADPLVCIDRFPPSDSISDQRRPLCTCTNYAVICCLSAFMWLSNFICR